MQVVVIILLHRRQRDKSHVIIVYFVAALDFLRERGPPVSRLFLAYYFLFNQDENLPGI